MERLSDPKHLPSFPLLLGGSEYTHNLGPPWIKEFDHNDPAQVVIPPGNQIIRFESDANQSTRTRSPVDSHPT